MTKLLSSSASQLHRRLAAPLLVIAAIFTIPPSLPIAHAQSQSTEQLGACTLKDHVYHCDGEAFQKSLSAATSVQIEARNIDGVARAQLTAFITKKLNKTVASPGSPADLSFLMLPVDDQGVLEDGTANGAPLGTLRIYTVEPNGSRGHLLWAETFSGQRDLPWPAVVRGLILQFQSRFHIK